MNTILLLLRKIRLKIEKFDRLIITIYVVLVMSFVLQLVVDFSKNHLLNFDYMSYMIAIVVISFFPFFLIQINHFRINKQNDLNDLKKNGVEIDAKVTTIEAFSKSFKIKGEIHYEFTAQNSTCTHFDNIAKLSDFEILKKESFVTITYLPDNPNTCIITRLILSEETVIKGYLPVIFVLIAFMFFISLVLLLSVKG